MPILIALNVKPKLIFDKIFFSLRDLFFDMSGFGSETPYHPSRIPSGYTGKPRLGPECGFCGRAKAWENLWCSDCDSAIGWMPRLESES